MVRSNPRTRAAPAEERPVVPEYPNAPITKIGWGDLGWDKLQLLAEILPSGQIIFALPEHAKGGQHLPFEEHIGGEWCAQASSEFGSSSHRARGPSGGELGRFRSPVNQRSGDWLVLATLQRLAISASGPTFLITTAEKSQLGRGRSSGSPADA